MTVSADSAPINQEPPGVTIQPGPGVVPPFAAPPREGNRRRMWISLGIGAAVALLCCGGGIVGIVTLAVEGVKAERNEAQAVVAKFMTDWQRQDYPAAYQLVCDDITSSVSLSEFTGQLQETQVESFQVQDPIVQDQAISVPVTVQFTDIAPATLSVDVTVDKGGDSQVCGGITR
jgi:hypothetical protein